MDPITPSVLVNHYNAITPLSHPEFSLDRQSPLNILPTWWLLSCQAWNDGLMTDECPRTTCRLSAVSRHLSIPHINLDTT